MTTEQVLALYPKADKVDGKKHLVATFITRSKKHGVFIVGTYERVLDRAAYREIASEAKSEGVDEMHIYGRICTYSGPGFTFENI